MKKVITKELVEEVFDACLETALNNPEIQKPYTWALYHTWKEIRDIEKPRRKHEK